jgi:glycosyltransferase involved in cell wall biosynthesis
MKSEPHIAVVIPCFNVERHIVDVIRTIPQWVATIVVVDDKSPDDFVAKVRALGEPRVVLIRHEHNQGVGGAMVTGYQECLRLGADIVVKMDGDGQMDPAYLAALIRPLLKREADFTKGNRWHDPRQLETMPAIRRHGSVALSFLTKMASGYWRLFDPCNGYTAIRSSVLRLLPLDRLARNFFFETSMLVELNVLGAVIRDVPIPARYGFEKSTMRISRVLLDFPLALVRAWKYRIWQRYFVRDFGAISLCLLGGALLTGWGLGFGGWRWLQSLLTGVPTTAGTVMLGAVPFLMGFQLLLQAAHLEVATEPIRPLSQHDAEDDDSLPRAVHQRAA